MVAGGFVASVDFEANVRLCLSNCSAHEYHIVLILAAGCKRTDSMESPECVREESNSLAKGPTERTSNRKSSTAQVEPVKKTRLFSLASSSKPTAATAVTRSGSTQLNSTASSFHSSQNFDSPNRSFESDYPSQRFRPEEYEEEDPADPYYSPPSTFIPPESPNDLKVQDSSPLAVLSSESQVRDAIWSVGLTLTTNTSENESSFKSTVRGTKPGTHSRVQPSVHRSKSGCKETQKSHLPRSLPSSLSPYSRHR